MIGAPVSLLQSQYDASTWAERGEILAAIFAQRDLADWVALLEGTDTCFAPVLRLSEVADHPHMKARSAYISRSEEHTSELQSLMRISYAVFCLKKKKIQKQS